MSLNLNQVLFTRAHITVSVIEINLEKKSKVWKVYVLTYGQREGTYFDKKTYRDPDLKGRPRGGEILLYNCKLGSNFSNGNCCTPLPLWLNILNEIVFSFLFTVLFSSTLSLGGKGKIRVTSLLKILDPPLTWRKEGRGSTDASLQWNFPSSFFLDLPGKADW